MKKIVLILVLLIANIVIFAQSPITQGQYQLNAGLGFSSWGLPVYVGLDYGFKKNITIGADASFRSYKDDWSGNSYSFTILGIAGNANYHFNEVLDLDKEWDLYAGINLGFYLWNSPSGYAGSHSSGIGLAGQIGGRYYFNSKWAVNLEFGGGNAANGGKFGITYKL